MMYWKTPSLFFITIIFLCTQSQAQYGEVIRQQACLNESFSPKVDSIKKALSAFGYTTVREASMSMESEYEMPVIAPLRQGAWYYIVFIGDNTSRLYEVRMFDSNDKQVVYKRNQWAEIDGNIIAYPYIPQFTELHMIKPVQVNKKKKKGLCGYIMILKKLPPAS